jgi:hypothetical protein
MPSVDPDTVGASMYPSSPPGPPPPGRAVDSPDRRGPSSHSGQYGYVHGGYGGPPPGGPPPSTYYPMVPTPQIPEKPGNQFYGHYPPQHHPHQQSYPGYGNPTPGPYMAYGYAGAPWMAYEGGGGPPGFYPSQQRLHTNDKVPSPSRASGSGANSHAAQYSTHDTASASDRRKDIHASSLSETQQQQAPNLKHMHTAEELDRLKAAAVVELGLSEVKPIQSDFHFFVHDNKYKILPQAIAEVDRKLEGKSAEFIRRHRTFLIHSNLNCRIMKAWEDLPRTEREEYFKTEEDDRQRFMEEDEVVSRHCFTLTARIRSPSKSKSPLQFGDTEDDANDKAGNDEIDRDDCDDEDDNIDGEQTSHIHEGKRLPEDSVIKEESPAKKNKAEAEGSALEEHQHDTDIDTQNKEVGDI